MQTVRHATELLSKGASSHEQHLRYAAIPRVWRGSLLAVNREGEFSASGG